MDWISYWPLWSHIGYPPPAVYSKGSAYYVALKKLFLINYFALCRRDTGPQKTLCILDGPRSCVLLVYMFDVFCWIAFGPLPSMQAMFTWGRLGILARMTTMLKAFRHFLLQASISRDPLWLDSQAKSYEDPSQNVHATILISTLSSSAVQQSLLCDRVHKLVSRAFLWEKGWGLNTFLLLSARVLHKVFVYVDDYDLRSSSNYRSRYDLLWCKYGQQLACFDLQASARCS